MSEETQSATSSEADDTVNVEFAQQQAQEFFKYLIADDYEQAFSLFSDELQAEFIEDGEARKPLVEPEPKPILEEFWRAMTSLYGPFEEIGEINSELDGGEAAVTVQLEYAASTARLKTTVDSAGNITEPPFGDYAPPAYVDESGITERDLSVETEDLSLGATLTSPATADEMPGVVLVHPAGEIDRDYSAGANKLLKDLALGLADRGIASLRYDKRNYETDIPEEEVDFDTVVTSDALDALKTLRGIDSIDSESMFVVGHSLGGTCAPYIAERAGALAGIVNLDGYNLGPNSELSVEDVKEYLEHRGHDSDYIDAQIGRLEKLAERIQSDTADPEENMLGKSASWIQHHEEYTDDWLPTTRSLSVPFLIVETGRYAPNNSARRAEKLRTELAEENVQVRYYEDLNHHFQKGRQVPNSVFESGLRKPPAETVIADSADFIIEVAEFGE